MVKNLPAALSVKQSCYFCFTDPGFEEDVQYKHKVKGCLARKNNNTTERPHLSCGEWDHPRQYIHYVGPHQVLVGNQHVGVRGKLEVPTAVV